MLFFNIFSPEMVFTTRVISFFKGAKIQLAVGTVHFWYDNFVSIFVRHPGCVFASVEKTKGPRLDSDELLLEPVFHVPTPRLEIHLRHGGERVGQGGTPLRVYRSVLRVANERECITF